jgi:hypothetical protein
MSELFGCKKECNWKQILYETKLCKIKYGSYTNDWSAECKNKYSKLLKCFRNYQNCILPHEEIVIRNITQ